jgi:hypothetical protein
LVTNVQSFVWAVAEPPVINVPAVSVTAIAAAPRQRENERSMILPSLSPQRLQLLRLR